MTGPCLCGDPACGSCFPGGQMRVFCTECGWRGRLHECGSDELSEEIFDTCPECDGDCEEEAR